MLPHTDERHRFYDMIEIELLVVARYKDVGRYAFISS
jgi:hypothetical protein